VPHCTQAMKSSIAVYNTIKQKVTFLYHKLKLNIHEKLKGRKPSITNQDAISLSLFKQKHTIATKKALYDIADLDCTYKTLVVSMNRVAKLIGYLFAYLLNLERRDAHIVKHTDATDIPVCINKNARSHKTMHGLAAWGYSGKGHYYGLKLHLTSDLRRRILSIRFSPGNVHDTTMFLKLNKGLFGIFVADAAYTSQKLAEEFHIEHRRILFAKPRKNMHKLISKFQYHLYNTRMTVEWNFRDLKQFYGLVTSMPRSVNGYFVHYLSTLLAYTVA